MQFLCLVAVLSMERALRGFPKPSPVGFRLCRLRFSLPSDHKKSALYSPSTSDVMQTDGDVAERASGLDFDVVGSSRICPEGFVAFFSIIPEGAGDAGQSCHPKAEGASQRNSWHHPSPRLIPSPRGLPIPQELQTLPARAGLIFKLIFKLIFTLIPFPNKLLGLVPPGCVCQLQLFPDRFGSGTGKSFCLEPLARHQQSPFSCT